MFKTDLFKGKTIVITGGGTGLGKSMAKRFAELGANLVITSRRKEVIQETSEKLKSHGVDVLPIPCDVKDPEQVENMAKRAIGHEHFSNLPKDLDKEISNLIFSKNKWESAISLDYCIQSKNEEILNNLKWEQLPRSRANKEIIMRVGKDKGPLKKLVPSKLFETNSKELTMYSTLEKTIILKSVELFKSIPAENLSKVAQITEEVKYSKDEPIFSEGDYGDSLFIVVDGEVKIHKGKQELALLKKGACLGEMALLDDEPRSADATITLESTLFKIEREGFYEVMAGQSVIMQGIIKLLTGRLRVANEKLMSK